MNDPSRQRPWWEQARDLELRLTVMHEKQGRHLMAQELQRQFQAMARDSDADD